MLYRTGTLIPWNNVAQPAGAVTGTLAISRTEFIGVFYQVSGATNIVLDVETTRGWFAFNTTAFTAAGEAFINVQFLAFQNIRFRTTAAVTLTIQVFLKA